MPELNNIEDANIQDGGDGAFYIYLKKKLNLKKNQNILVKRITFLLKKQYKKLRKKNGQKH